MAETWGRIVGFQVRLKPCPLVSVKTAEGGETPGVVVRGETRGAACQDPVSL